MKNTAKIRRVARLTLSNPVTGWEKRGALFGAFSRVWRNPFDGRASNMVKYFRFGKEVEHRSEAIIYGITKTISHAFKGSRPRSACSTL